MSILFFRNDDVRGALDNSLVQITDLFIKHRIPITHAVEPANVTPEVVEWLLSVKQTNPDLIEIMQHGYDHSIKNKQQKGEFGGQRTYEEQYDDIKRGKELMNRYFGSQWFECFNFPYAPYNLAAIKAVNDVGFKVLNSHYNSGLSRQIFYFAGHLLHKGYLLNHHVSWNLKNYPGTSLFEVDMNVSFIKKYLNEQAGSIMLTLEELIERTREYVRQRTIGVLLHHRYHDAPEKIDLVDQYLDWCRTQPFEFKTIEAVYEKFSK